LSIEQAREKASDYGVAVEDAQWIHHPAAHEGQVIDQSIQPGARVRHGRRIDLTVSRGQNLVPVPYLRTRPVTLAVASLDLLRLQIHVANTAYDEWVNAGAISWQDPRAGSLVPADTVVTVVVSRGPPHHAARTEDAAR
jgi:eukaryotic-like serine/threonine-protein kinase